MARFFAFIPRVSGRMSLRVIFIILACVYVSHSWNLDAPGRFPSVQEQQLSSGVLKRPPCFGLARRTRHLKINVPVIYNRRTGQASPIPRTLLNADGNLVAKIENDGWEVRRNIIAVPQQTYERVPVCCPWDQNCDQGRSDAQSFDAPGSCANGGQMIYRDGLQRCECPPGYQGSWCQTPDSGGDNQPNTNFPSGPLIQPVSPSTPNILKEADFWRAKTMQMPMPSILLPKDNLLAAVARPWAVRAAMMKQQQNMRAKLAQAEEMYRHAQGDFYNQMPPPGVLPFDVRRNMNAWRGNPYSPMDDSGSNAFTSGQETDQNPYNSVSFQGQLPQNMMRAFSAVQQNLRETQAANPYSRMPQENPNPHLLALIQRMKGRQGDLNPYNRLPQGDLNPYNRQPQDDLNPYNRRPQGDLNPYRRRPQDAPQARTPWDLDPFGQQQNPSYMNYPGMPVGPNRNQQAMAMALYQQMMNQQRGRLSERNKALSRPLLGATGFQNPVVTSPVHRDSQPQPLVTNTSLGGNNQTEQELSTNVSNSSNQTDEQQSPINEQPEMPLDVARGHQQQSSSEQVNRIDQCRAVMMPKLSVCLQSYELTMEQFMNPEHMARARAVCDASQSVGQCLMQYDKVCGEGEAILTTRRLINSVLRMMGMVCQQIAARGGTPIIPGQGPQELPQIPLSDAPSQNAEQMTPNQPASFNNNPLVPLNEEQMPPVNDNGVDEREQTLAPKSSTKNGEAASEAPVSKGSMGHDSAHPVSLELKLFGYPLWLIVTLGLALFLAFVLFLVVLCMCCRRRCRQKSGKSNKEIEKIPMSLDGKKCTVDIRPPSYHTATVLQNEDGLSLPPLDLSDESGNASLESINEKPTLDEDSDGESDAKEEQGKRK